MFFLHKEPNGYFTINQNSHLDGIQGEPFETVGAAVYFGRVWQIQWEENHKRED